MAKTNVLKEKKKVYTAEGARAKVVNPELQLRRAVMSCLLWEDAFYIGGKAIADHIADLVPQVDPEKVQMIAVEARHNQKLRHVPLLICCEMAKHKTHKHLVAATVEACIQRADELTEILAIYSKGRKGTRPLAKLSNQIKLGVARAFNKFDAYKLQKYNRKDAQIKLRDALFLCHAKPKNEEQAAVFKQLVDNTLPVPDTWETELMVKEGEDKSGSWTRLLKEEKLGALALIRNLRNMNKAKVDRQLVREALEKLDVQWVLPFRFLTAAVHAPEFESELEQAMYRATRGKPKLKGKTILIVDVSGSMYGASMSAKSDVDRAKAACSLAVLVRELCEDPVIYATAGNDGTRMHKTKKVPARRGFALSDAIYQLCHPLGGGGIFLKQVMDYVGAEEERTADRVIVITDEQDCGLGDSDSPLKADSFGKKNYLINVSVEKHGIAYDQWCHIDGFSESVLDFMREYEASDSLQ